MSVHGKNTVILVDAGNLTEYFNNQDLPETIDSNDTTTFGHDSKTSVSGLRSGSMSLQGFYDGTPTGINAILNPYLGAASDQVVSTAPAGFALGNAVDMLQSQVTNYKKTSVVTDVTKIGVDFKADGPIDAGYSLHNLTPAETATGNSSNLDNGAATSNGGVAHIHCPTVSGTNPTNISKIQHSSDNVTYLDLVTFTQLTAAGSRRVEVAAGTTVNRYLREAHTIGGTNPSFGYAVAFARR